jgi:Mu transposase, C-terminal domain
MSQWSRARVNIDYHIAFDGNFYSVPYTYPDKSFFALPIIDTAEDYSYPPVVRFEIAQNDLAAYQTAADFLNTNNIDLVCLQHEYGIFGGMAGSHVWRC